jgi:hypothetical protein
VDKLRELRTAEEVVKDLGSVFPTAVSFQWYDRMHREALIASGVRLKIANRVFYHAPRLERFVLEQGRRTAQRVGKDDRSPVARAA